jgi:hypothetical protein
MGQLGNKGNIELNMSIDILKEALKAGSDHK